MTEFQQTPIPGAYIVKPNIHSDERGFFARTWSAEEFATQGLSDRLVQCSISFSPRRGTLRGMHFQRGNAAEAKLVRCTSGAVYDVTIDLRPDSSAFTRHVAVELSASNRLSMYVPEGCAHGLLTLLDDTEVFYQMNAPHVALAAAGVRWDDPAFSIKWPEPVRVISVRDSKYPDFVSSPGSSHDVVESHEPLSDDKTQ